MANLPTDDRSLPLRERKRLRTRRALADAALRMFTEKGFEATTLEELVDEVEVSKSTFFRAFPAKEAVAIEAEAEVWSAYLTALGERELSGVVLAELHDTLAGAAAVLEPGWDERYVATRRLVLTAPASRAGRTHHHRLERRRP
jgi:AcrR family transcriptional regulator